MFLSREDYFTKLEGFSGGPLDPTKNHAELSAGLVQLIGTKGSKPKFDVVGGQSRLVGHEAVEAASPKSSLKRSTIKSLPFASAMISLPTTSFCPGN